VCSSDLSDSNPWPMDPKASVLPQHHNAPQKPIIIDVLLL